MYGAIFGDIIGSRFEFDRGPWTKDFELFTKQDEFTDDTVMTIAVGEGLLNAGPDATVDEIRKSVISSMRAWGKKYPNAGYGCRFYEWLFSHRQPKPYGSYGNGSAMRVSAAGWLYDSLERTREVARATAEVTHNHPEGIKGAECTAAVMYLARTGANKAEITDYVTREFGYDLAETLEQMRQRHKHDETCQDSLPKALRAFFDGESYEDVVRNAVSLGGDTDTIAAIAGAMAEAFYGMPILIMADGKEYLPTDILEVLDGFDLALGRTTGKEDEEDPYENNKYIKIAIDMIKEEQNEEAYDRLFRVLWKRILEEGTAPTPMVDVNGVIESIDPKSLTVGGTFTLNQEMRLVINKLQDGEGNVWVPLFTDDDEINEAARTNVQINMSILKILQEVYLYEKSNGLIINPFGNAMAVPKEVLKILIDSYEEKNGGK